MLNFSRPFLSIFFRGSIGAGMTLSALGTAAASMAWALPRRELARLSPSRSPSGTRNGFLAMRSRPMPNMLAVPRLHAADAEATAEDPLPLPPLPEPVVGDLASLMLPTIDCHSGTLASIDWMTLVDERDDVGESTLTLSDDVDGPVDADGAAEESPALEEELMRWKRETSRRTDRPAKQAQT